MSKDDFRDRLKSYSSEANHSDWVKMQQLLDADKDDRKAIGWWRYGLILALVLIPASILLYSYSSNTEEISISQSVDFKTNLTQDTRVKTQDAKLETEVSRVVTQDSKENTNPNTAVEQNANLSNNKNLQTTSSFNNTSNTNTTKTKLQTAASSIFKPSTTSKAKTSKTKTIKSEDIFSRPQANTSSQLSTSKVSEKIPSLNAPKANQILPASINVIAGIAAVDFLSPDNLQVAERTLPSLSNSPFTKVYPEQKSNPLYLVSGVGVKYPIVDISNADSGSLVPTQKFFPSYFAELGAGKQFGSFSLEGGIAAALYQFKLGEFSSEAPEADLISLNEFSQRLEDAENNFIINKFAVISPYLRAQYSFDLKKNYILGLYSMVHLNRKIELPNEVFSDQFATNYDRTVEFNNVGEELKSSKSNMNYDLGISLEKQFAKRGRVALDFSYSFATGFLEEGNYSVLRNTSAESNGAYTISGMGPKVKFRYYLNLGT